MIEIEEAKEKQIEVNVNFKATIDEKFLDEFKRIIDHHLDYFLDLARFPEIKAIYDARADVPNESNKCRDYYMIYDKDLVGYGGYETLEEAHKFFKKNKHAASIDQVIELTKEVYRKPSKKSKKSKEAEI